MTLPAAVVPRTASVRHASSAVQGAVELGDGAGPVDPPACDERVGECGPDGAVACVEADAEHRGWEQGSEVALDLFSIGM